MDLDQLLHANRPYPKQPPPERFSGMLYTVYTRSKRKEHCCGHEHLLGATLPLQPEDFVWPNEEEIEFPEYTWRQKLYG